MVSVTIYGTSVLILWSKFDFYYEVILNAHISLFSQHITENNPLLPYTSFGFKALLPVEHAFCGFLLLSALFRRRIILVFFAINIFQDFQCFALVPASFCPAKT